mmetsp:Transcript_9892/g.25019  ORF Transcript_9892/g.25019 Transcript_9892/m.25019 type:complete len:244 (+) Transcript_9892:159-890(+)
MDEPMAQAILASWAEDEFAAARRDERDVLRAFAAVRGSEALCAARSVSRNEAGRTLLHVAAFWGASRAVKTLLQLGADVHAIDSTAARVTPLLEAARAGQTLTCRRLLEAGANIKDQDAWGDSCFHWCARKGNRMAIAQLLQAAEKVKPGSTAGVLELRNARGRTCLDVAQTDSVHHFLEQEQLRALRPVAQLSRKQGLHPQQSPIQPGAGSLSPVSTLRRLKTERSPRAHAMIYSPTASTLT